MLKLLFRPGAKRVDRRRAWMRVPPERCHPAHDAGPCAYPCVPGAKQRQHGPVDFLPYSKGARIGGDVCEGERIAGDIPGAGQEAFGQNERRDGTTGKKLRARFVALLRQRESIAVWRNHFGDEIDQAVENRAASWPGSGISLSSDRLAA